MLKLDSKAKFTNHAEFWVITQTNRLGFIDRETISPERASESCHIALIGYSFIETKEVEIADKAQVKLEEIVAIERPHLDITASAYGRSGIGQINRWRFTMSMRGI